MIHRCSTAPVLATLGCAVLAASPSAPAAAQLGTGDLFANGLDTTFDSSVYTLTFHDERFAPNTNQGSSDFSQLFGFDYGGLTGGPAPGSTTTNGLLAQVNGTDDVPGDAPERVAVNFHPNITIDSTTTDWVMTVNAFAFNLGGASNTTLSYVAGLSTAGVRANWQGGTSTDGLFWSLTTDGKATTDLLSFQGNPNAPATSFAPADIDGNPINTDRAEPGTAGQWVTLAVGSHANTPFFALRDGSGAWEMIETFNNTTGPTSGTPFFGVEDPFNSANGNVGVVFDNVSAQTLLQGDTNFDGDVDFTDAMVLRQNFSGAGVAADTGGAVPGGFDANLWLWTSGDFDQDRDVDFDDALKVVANYTGRTATQVAGEPTLLVNTVTGDLSLAGEPQGLTGLSITSAAGALEGGDGDGLVLMSTAEEFTMLTLDSGEPGELGVGFAIGSAEDLVFQYGDGDRSVIGQVVYVPEPGTVGLLVLGGLVAAMRKRRTVAG